MIFHLIDVVLITVTIIAVACTAWNGISNKDFEGR